MFPPNERRANGAGRCDGILAGQLLCGLEGRIPRANGVDCYDVIIVGAGPAGTATALNLLRADAALRGRLLLLDKAVHPRDKVCAGGLIPHTLDCLRDLNVPLDVPHVRAERARVHVPPDRTVSRDDHVCVVVRRNAFDHLLLRTAAARGAAVRQDEKVVGLVREPDAVCVVTERGRYRARVVVGADGSGSRVRRALVGPTPRPVGKALMCDVPVADTLWDGFARRRADFDFRPVRFGLRGYLWAFPCTIGGTPHVNVGAYSLGTDARSDARAKTALNAWLERTVVRRLDGSTAALRLRAFPICGYAATRPLAAPRVVLVGDAAGAEPLMGEGISFAFEYGAFAAAAVHGALRSGDVSFAAYTHDLARAWFGKKLARLGLATRLFYGPTSRAWFALAARSERLQSIGLKWYNGVDDWHRRSGWAALRAVLAARGPQPAPAAE